MPTPSQAQVTDPVRLTPASGPVLVDGRLQEPAWESAARVMLRFEVSPGENRPAPMVTECRVTFDEDRLYIGCAAADPAPDAVRAYYTDRDALDGQDRIVVTVDPFADSRRGWQFGVNALGVQYDASVAQEGGQVGQPGRLRGDPAWDAIWDAAARLTPDGYVVEMAVPFGVLRFPAEPGRAWGLVISRYAPRDTEVELRNTPWDRASGCALCQTQPLVGLDGLTPGRRLQMTPSATIGRTDRRTTASAAGLVPGAFETQPALDVRWNATSALAAAVTMNPDFSQVEADALQLDVNTRFALFFPEKRPFFLDGAELFATPLNAVFSRTVADPVAGARLTGSAGATTAGVLVATDAAPGVLLPGSQFSRHVDLTQPVTTVIARARHDIGRSSSVGGLLTSREGGAYSNRVFGADALLRPTEALTARVQVLGSMSRYPSAVAGEGEIDLAPTGVAGLASLRYTPRDWDATVRTQWMTPGVRLDAGFEPRVNMRSLDASLRRRVWADGAKWFTELSPGAGVWYAEDWSGRMLEETLWVGADYRGPGQTVVNAYLNFAQRERIDTDPSPIHATAFVRVAASPVRWAGGAVTLQRGGAVDLVNGRLSTRLIVSPSVTLRPGRHLQVHLAHTMQRFAHAGLHVFTAHGSETRATYTLSARTFVRAVVQYESTSRDLSQYPAGLAAGVRRLTMQWHYSYKVNPQTALFLGYADGRGATDVATFGAAPLQPHARTFFMKVGYAWRP